MLAELALLAATCAPQIHPVTLTAIVKHESGFNQYAIGINKGKRLPQQPRNRAEAIKIVKDLIDQGVDFDAGLGQINVRNWQWLGLTPEKVFDPCTNLKAAQAVLKDCYVRATSRFQAGQPALMAAFSCYNTGNFQRGFDNGYVGKVLASAGVQVPQIAQATQGRSQNNGGSQSSKPAEGANENQQAPRREGIADGFDGNAIQDGFSRGAVEDGFIDPRVNEPAAPNEQPDAPVSVSESSL
ncbi:MAG: lytic transglycosylase domain-containing protein [Acidithiobacillus sp.]